MFLLKNNKMYIERVDLSALYEASKLYSLLLKSWRSLQKKGQNYCKIQGYWASEWTLTMTELFTHQLTEAVTAYKRPTQDHVNQNFKHGLDIMKSHY